MKHGKHVSYHHGTFWWTSIKRTKHVVQHPKPVGGIKCKINGEELVHREDGPALVSLTGNYWWYRFGHQLSEIYESDPSLPTKFLLQPIREII
jgi:hypothetical protein